jgi:hypothetical protein
MFSESVFIFITLIYFFFIEYAIVQNKTKLASTNYYYDPKKITYFSTKIDIKFFIYIIIIITNNMVEIMYLTCAVRFMSALIDYLKYCLNGTIEMSREVAHSLYCLTWLITYFYMTDNMLHPHLVTILGSMIGVSLTNKRIDS